MPERICQSCGSKLAEDARFCPTCGKEVAVKVCPACGAKLTEGAKFCQGCGTAVTSTPPQSVAGKQVSEPRANIVVNEKEKSHLRRMSILSTSVGIGLAIIAIIMFVYFVKAGAPASMMGSNGQGTVPTTTTSKTSTTSTTTSTGKTLNDLLSLSSNIVSIKYDMSITGQGIPTTAVTVWAKKNQMRTEMTQQGMNVITLIDTNAKTMYTYMPAQNLAMKIPFDPAQVPKSPNGDVASIQNSNARVTGTGTIDGKVCSIIEYISAQGNVKAWIWQDKGLPILTETTTPAGKITVEYKNIDFADISDSMFELPAGVKIM
jgi:RNA polymerase subunit RPABC4/transcription elongation factor Spt4